MFRLKAGIFFETTALVSVVTLHETKYKSTVELLGGFEELRNF